MPSRAENKLKRPLRLDIAARLPSARPLVPALRRQLRAAYCHLAHPLSRLSLVLVGDREMARLHHRFLDISGPTDVLTFPLDIDTRGVATEGEIIICVPEARRRARVEGVELSREILLYALHGMLHLAGYSDKTDRGFRLMHRREDQILTKLGVGPVFATPRSRRAVGAD